MMALMMFQFSIVILSTLGFQFFINTINDKINLKYFISILGLLLIFFITFKFFIIDINNINENVLLQVKDMLQNDLNRSIIILLCIMT